MSKPTTKEWGDQMGGLFNRAAFALRLGDFNLLISPWVPRQVAHISLRDVQQMAFEGARSWLTPIRTPIVDNDISTGAHAYTPHLAVARTRRRIERPVCSGQRAADQLQLRCARRSRSYQRLTARMTFYAMDTTQSAHRNERRSPMFTARLADRAP